MYSDYGNKHSNPYYQAAIRRNIANNARKTKLRNASANRSAAQQEYPEEVRFLLSGEASWSGFINSVRRGFEEYGTLTPAQVEGINKVRAGIKRKAEEQAAEPKVEVGVVGMATIAKLLKTAADSGNFKRAPKFLVGVFAGEGDDKVLMRKLRVYLAGATSSWKGWLQVKVGQEWVGRVNPATGEIHGPKLKNDPSALSALKAFEADPFDAIHAYGALSSECCFCSKALTDDRSRSKGYGPVCAKHWGLPWG